MLRYLLALFILLTTMCSSADALCIYEQPQTESCCCCEEQSDCTEMSGDCCGVTEKSPAAPQTPTRTVSPAAAISFDSHAVIALAERVCDDVLAESKPLHLGTNKLYLRKRTLLI